MGARMRHPTTVMAVMAAAFWPVWPWYVSRIGDGSDEPWCVVALAAALALAWLSGGPRTYRLTNWTEPSLFVIAYAAVCYWLPPIFSAAVALLAIGAVFTYYRTGRLFGPGVWGLLVLSAPLMSSVQFYFGYPLRIVVGIAAAFVLRIGGFAIQAEGTVLRWGERIVEVDAPCSGVKMLWAAMFLTFALAAIHRLQLKQTAIASAAGLFIVIAANVFRAAALFYTESGLLDAPAWTHGGVGILMFGATAIAVYRVSALLQGVRA
jgi:exosortase/archaeosortase family protein